MQHARSRNSSGMGTSRRSSANFDRSVNTGPPQTPKHISPSHDLQQHPIKEESSHAHPDRQATVRATKEDKSDDDHNGSSNSGQSKVDLSCFLLCLIGFVWANKFVSDPHWCSPD